jgi:hypothetical protein
MEEWGVDPHRLTFANIQDATENGARAVNHACVVDLIRDGPNVLGVRYRGSDGSLNEARAIAGFASAFRTVAIVTVPELAGDVQDVPGLRRVADRLFAPADGP